MRVEPNRGQAGPASKFWAGRWLQRVPRIRGGDTPVEGKSARRHGADEISGANRSAESDGSAPTIREPGGLESPTMGECATARCILRWMWCSMASSVNLSTI